MPTRELSPSYVAEACDVTIESLKSFLAAARAEGDATAGPPPAFHARAFRRGAVIVLAAAGAAGVADVSPLASLAAFDPDAPSPPTPQAVEGGLSVVRQVRLLAEAAMAREERKGGVDAPLAHVPGIMPCEAAEAALERMSGIAFASEVLWFMGCPDLALADALKAFFSARDLHYWLSAVTTLGAIHSAAPEVDVSAVAEYAPLPVLRAGPEAFDDLKQWMERCRPAHEAVRERERAVAAAARRFVPDPSFSPAEFDIVAPLRADQVRDYFASPAGSALLDVRELRAEVARVREFESELLARVERLSATDMTQECDLAGPPTVRPDVGGNEAPEQDPISPPYEFVDPDTGNCYRFTRPMLWELWRELYKSKRRLKFTELRERITRWIDSPVEDKAINTAVTELRDFWRKKYGRDDLADRLRVMNKTAGLDPAAA